MKLHRYTATPLHRYTKGVISQTNMCLALACLFMVTNLTSRAQIEVHSNNNVEIGSAGGGMPNTELWVRGHAHINCSPAQWGGYFFENFQNDGEDPDPQGQYNDAILVPNTSHNNWLGNSENRLWRIHTHGLYYGPGGLNTYSDSTIKTNIVRIDPQSALSRISQINGYTFDYTRDAFPNTPDELLPRVMESSSGQIGLIAQELVEVFPEVVNYSEYQGLYTVDYVKLIPVLIEAIKAQQEEIEELKKRIE